MYGRTANGLIDGGELLNPGLLRHQIIWQEKKVTSQDSYGQDVYRWSDFLRTRARVQATGGREMQAVMQQWAEAKYQITQHFSRGLTADMRIAWLNDGNVTYLEVLNIDDPPETGRYQVVVCKNFEEVEVVV